MRTLEATILTLGLAVLAACEPTEPMARAEARWSQCTPCHGADGHGKLVQAAPPISGLPAWYIESQLVKYRAEIRGSHFDDGPGMRMKPMAMTLPSEQDVKEMSDYIAAMKPAPNAAAAIKGFGPNAAGTFGLCMACHGADGSGNKALNAPPIAGQPDWYVYEQLRKFKSGARGSNPRDVTGSQMRAIALGLGDDNALHDLARYVADLPVKRPQ